MGSCAGLIWMIGPAREISSSLHATCPLKLNMMLARVPGEFRTGDSMVIRGAPIEP